MTWARCGAHAAASATAATAHAATYAADKWAAASSRNAWARRWFSRHHGPRLVAGRSFHDCSWECGAAQALRSRHAGQARRSCSMEARSVLDEHQGNAPLEVILLGTSSSNVTASRFQSCTAVRFPDHSRAEAEAGESGHAVSHSKYRTWLVDVGWGVLEQFRRLNGYIDVLEVDKIFITHFHGDHINGLEHFLVAQDSACKARGLAQHRLQIVGPLGIKAFTQEVVAAVCGHDCRLDLQFLELQTRLSKARWSQISSLMRNVRIGDVFSANQKSGTDQSFASQSRRIAPLDGLAQVVGKSLAGRAPRALFDVLEEGSEFRVRVRAAEVEHSIESIGYAMEFHRPMQDTPPRKIAIIGDTRNPDAMVSLVQDCDLLIHECSFPAHLIEIARRKGHSCTTSAAQFASKVGAKCLVLNHIAPQLAFFPAVHAAGEVSRHFSNPFYFAVDMMCLRV
ncbi:Ribonuclease Z [Porphyridium purpureum]|uniref:Ribonuclease Z n=1 Tax=Porphyridium purpureum TaxID=35688 RepID=A0A5J4YSM3_PORPP|nr:Ribonuclease Z [Porphyridium purpureum]|eukprot:POR3381..scf236_6